MVIEDKFVVPAPIGKTWAYLTDIPRVSACLPGVTLTEQNPDGTYKGQFKVKVGPISTYFKGSASVEINEAPGPVRVNLEGKDRLTGTVVVGSMSMGATPASETETEVTYSVDVNIRGKLGQMAQGVIRDTAKRMTREFSGCVAEQMAAHDSATAST